MNEQFRDRILECKQCQQQFVWTAGEQSFYHDRRLLEPKRCKPCRDAFKQAINAAHERQAQRP